MSLKEGLNIVFDDNTGLFCIAEITPHGDYVNISYEDCFYTLEEAKEALKEYFSGR